ncbi:MAG: hypothetical protein J7K96_06150 [Desulfobacteraceae bacterium]|nr:hypothetical protein [Desulfobacteraceae bacterium]
MDRKLFFLIIMAFFISTFFPGCTTHNAVMTFQKETGQMAHPGIDYLKAIVVYDSWSGNTELIADEIARVLHCPSVKVDNAEEYTMAEYNLIVVGSPVHGGMPTDEIENFLSSLETIHASAVFVTYGAPLFGSFTANRCLDSMEEKLQGTSLGRFKCNGFHKIFLTYPRHPDKEDKSEAALFAAGLMERVPYDNLPEKQLLQQ